MPMKPPMSVSGTKQATPDREDQPPSKSEAKARGRLTRWRKTSQRLQIPISALPTPDLGCFQRRTESAVHNQNVYETASDRGAHRFTLERSAGDRHHSLNVPKVIQIQ